MAIAMGMAQHAGAIDVVTQEDFTLGIGLRLQPRLELENEVGPKGTDWRRDFILRRSRLSGFGKMQNVYYKFEWKIDGTDQVASSSQTATGSITSAQLENGYLQYPVGNGVEIRAGLYDIPYSRDRLTSDSQQLAVDRGAVSNVPNALGLVDNGVGLHVLGKINGGRAEYAVGLFDNRTLAAARCVKLAIHRREAVRSDGRRADAHVRAWRSQLDQREAPSGRRRDHDHSVDGGSGTSTVGPEAPADDPLRPGAARRRRGWWIAEHYLCRRHMVPA